MESKVRRSLENVFDCVEWNVSGTETTLKVSKLLEGLAQLNPDDSDSLSRFEDVSNLLAHSWRDLNSRARRILVGTTVFTPGLVEKGWLFWRKMGMTDSEIDFLKTAIDSWMLEIKQTFQESKPAALRASGASRIERLNRIITTIGKAMECDRRFSQALRHMLSPEVGSCGVVEPNG